MRAARSGVEMEDVRKIHAREAIKWIQRRLPITDSAYLLIVWEKSVTMDHVVFIGSL